MCRSVPDATPAPPPPAKPAKGPGRHRPIRRSLVLGMTPRAAIGLIIGSAVGVAVVGAALVFTVDSKAFTSFGDAIWFAIVTVGTVGYGDVVPSNMAGRIVASIVILFTMAFFPLLTGIITASLIERNQADAREDDLQDARDRHDQLIAELKAVQERLDRLEGP